MRKVVVTGVPRPAEEKVRRVGGFGVSTLHEAMGRTGLMRPYMRPIYPGARVFGTAVTVLCHPGDNLMIHAAIEVCRPGDVLVVTTTAPSTDGMFGELLATSARAHGVQGLVIEAGVRDVEVLAEMQFPVWSRAISAQGTVKETAGAVNVPVVCAGVLVHPGDVVVADGDGVVCVPKDHLDKVAEQAAARVEREERTRQRLASGELGVDIYGLRDKLRRLGVEYVSYEEWRP